MLRFYSSVQAPRLHVSDKHTIFPMEVLAIQSSKPITRSQEAGTIIRDKQVRIYEDQHTASKFSSAMCLRPLSVTRTPLSR
jgi:hypothetical protein